MSEPALAPTTAGSKLRLRFWLQLLKASRHIENELRDRLRREFCTTLPRFDVLAMLDKTPAGLKMSQLSSGMMVSNGNITGIVDRLVSDGLVKRVEIKGDRRATLVQLTDKGKSDFIAMARVHELWVTELLADLNDVEIKNSITTLTKVRG